MALLDRPDLTFADMRAHFDGLDAQGCWDEVERYGKRQLVRMYELAAEAEPIGAAHFVPEELDELAVVRHRGRNSIPVPIGAFRWFEKPMTRVPQHPGVFCGYNEGATKDIIGPGFFICRPTDESEQDRGAWVVDYLTVPEGPMPEGWPSIRPNEQGLQRWVYAGTRDYMRKVSERVSIGMPFRGDSCLGMPFVLVRYD